MRLGVDSFNVARRLSARPPDHAIPREHSLQTASKYSHPRGANIVEKKFKQSDIERGDRVTILVPSGIGRSGVEYRRRSGVAVMHSATGGWVLNMGGAHGTPGLADENNTVAVRKVKTDRRGTHPASNR
jgi:hypothetical protein